MEINQSSGDAERVDKIMAKWLPKWREKSDKAVLNPEDGQTSLYQGG